MDTNIKGQVVGKKSEWDEEVELVSAKGIIINIF